MPRLPFIYPLCSLTILLCAAVGFNAAANPIIEGLRIWPSPENVRIVFDLGAKVDYNITKSEQYNKISIHFKAKLSNKFKQQFPKTEAITNIEFTDTSPVEVVVTFSLKEKMEYKDFTLLPNQYYGHRLVLDLEADINDKQAILALFNQDMPKDITYEPAVPKMTAATSIAVARPGQYIVALDPGHGGEDPGAIGPRGTKEKDVVLQIAKEVNAILTREQKYKGILIRRGDYYVGLRDRVLRSRKHNPDLFVSIHADAHPKSNATGASVYMLSDKGATSEAARWLAERENRADVIGGVNIDDKNDVLAKVLLDLSQTANETASLTAGNTLINSLGQVTNMHKLRVEKAGFAVLKAPDVPSILVETGFISNYGTEVKLRNSTYQKKLAGAIALGIKQYLNQNVRFNQYNISQQNNGRYITVKKGDTLTKIAREHKVSVQDLQKWNKLTTNVLSIGQKIALKSAD